ncbi:MAG TPA: hypothetical protein VGO47_13720 [Chlamydiales bacterium]|nr:hypothetical protein [Chlamydiales bacterium]
MPAGIRPYVSLPLAARKSLAGFIAASLTAGLITFSFWGWIAPLRSSEAVWTWDHGKFGGWTGLSILSIFSALVGGMAEALGKVKFLLPERRLM